MKLSFIIPVFNVEDYLEDCLYSIYNQLLTVSDFELVIVDDGSTDNSMAIVNIFKNKYGNIKVFNQPNLGPSAARNLAIKNAEGLYILGVDSDDFLIKNKVSSLLNLALELDLDVLRAEYQYSDSKGNLIQKSNWKKERESYAEKLVDGTTLYTNLYCREFFTPLLMIKRSFLIDNDLLFEEGIYFEDVDFSTRLSFAAKRVMYIPEIFYVYRLRDGSITHSINKKKLDDLIYVISKLHNYLKSNRINNEMRKVISENITQLLVYAILRLSSDRLLYKYRKNIITTEVINQLSPLFVSGDMKEKMISYLFNIVGLSVVSLFYPIMTLKIKLLGYSY